MFELAEEALDQIALSIDASIDGAMHDALAGRRDVCFGASCPDQVEQCVGVIGTIGNDMLALEAFEKVWRGANIMCLTCGQYQPNRKAILVDKSVDLGAQSATRAADGVIFAPFLPPAACWWARMIELSISAIE